MTWAAGAENGPGRRGPPVRPPPLYPEQVGERIVREALPVHERLGDVRERAVTLGRIADIITERGRLEELGDPRLIAYARRRIGGLEAP